MKIVAESAYEDIDEGLSAFECPADALHETEIVAEDDVSGERLDSGLVRAARKEEIAYFRSMGVYRKVPIQKMLRYDRKATSRRPMDRHQ